MRICTFRVVILVILAILTLSSYAPAAAFDGGSLSFEDRLLYQRRIEEVYWRHRIWPAANPRPKPALEEVLPDSVMRERVNDYLLKSAALEAFWSRPVTGEQLQTEVDRMARDTRNPELLRDLLAALDDDPFLVAECLARPLLTNRLMRSAHTEDATAYEQAELGGGSVTVLPPVGGYELPPVRHRGCSLNTWTTTSTGPGVPSARTGHTAIWTGSEMIVWGGHSGEAAHTDTGGRYDPATDSWTATSTGANVPSARSDHTAVWTGTAMIVWGGDDDNDTGPHDSGGAYSPLTDSWNATSAGSGVPRARTGHSAIWTGSEMIVWGGLAYGGDNLWDGGRYDPQTDHWAATSVGTGVPLNRERHHAVWTGTKMIVWGGYQFLPTLPLYTGGRYDPTSDSWTATSDFLSARIGSVAVWTGTDMFVWGGLKPLTFRFLNDGGLYDPVTDGWATTSTSGDVPSPRWGHTAVWTGTQIIVWGGDDLSGSLERGGMYDPVADSWTATSVGADLPTSRSAHTAVWTGAQMIVWGGLATSSPFDSFNSGGLFCACDGDSVSVWYPDSDGDGHGGGSTGVPSCVQPAGYVSIGDDCDDTNADTYSGAAEINDGRDNQCAGDPGYGLVDEIGGVCGFFDAANRNELSWTSQPSATSYEVARSTDPRFVADCFTYVTATSSWDDETPPPVGACLHYLVRSLQPNTGSWGAGAMGAERTPVCP